MRLLQMLRPIGRAATDDEAVHTSAAALSTKRQASSPACFTIARDLSASGIHKSSARSEEELFRPGHRAITEWLLLSTGGRYDVIAHNVKQPPDLQRRELLEPFR